MADVHVVDLAKRKDWSKIAEHGVDGVNVATGTWRLEAGPPLTGRWRKEITGRVRRDAAPSLCYQRLRQLRCLVSHPIPAFDTLTGLPTHVNINIKKNGTNY